MERRPISVVIAAAGSGSRFGRDINKQYITLSGKPILARTIQVFEDSSIINEIIVVVRKSELAYCREEIVGKYEFAKVKDIVPGGADRQASVYCGLEAVRPECGIVVIHDGARPFVDDDIIRQCIETTRKYGASCTAIQVTDTIKRGDGKGSIEETIDRNDLWYVQTPQVFEYKLILDAHRKAVIDGFTGTDDSMLAERLGIKVRLVAGSHHNIKITTREDLIIAKAILAADSD